MSSRRFFRGIACLQGWNPGEWTTSIDTRQAPLYWRNTGLVLAGARPATRTWERISSGWMPTHRGCIASGVAVPHARRRAQRVAPALRTRHEASGFRRR
ncbi:hypothetical protein IG631_08326 [Alternaria alternata]|nr:hypothetical protein IG631_08326 [Alternaria alternata]